MQDTLEEKLAAYQRVNGVYPDSLELLSFTNSTLELAMLPDVRKIDYQHTQVGYVLLYESASGYKHKRTFASEDFPK